MAIDTSNIITSLQKKINKVDVNSSPEELVNLLKAVKKADGASLTVYDSDGVLPDPNAKGPRVAYVRGQDRLKLNTSNTRWASVRKTPIVTPFVASSIVPQFVGFAETAAVNAQQLTTTIPAGAQAGDLLVVMCANGYSTSSSDPYYLLYVNNTNTGVTEVHNYDAGNSAGKFRQVVYSKTLTAADITYSTIRANMVSGDSTASAEMFVWVIRNATTVTNVDENYTDNSTFTSWNGYTSTTPGALGLITSAQDDDDTSFGSVNTNSFFPTQNYAWTNETAPTGGYVLFASADSYDVRVRMNFFNPWGEELKGTVPAITPDAPLLDVAYGTNNTARETLGAIYEIT